MKQIFVIVLLVIAASSYAQGQAKSRRIKDLQQELMQLQRAEDEAEDKKDVAALDRLLSEEFIFTQPNGVVTDKKKLIAEVAHDNEPATDETITYDELKTFDYGTTGVVNYLLLVKGRDKDGKDFSNRYRNTVVWVKQQGRWRMAAIHVSRIRP